MQFKKPLPNMREIEAQIMKHSAGLTWKEVAEHLGVRQSAVSNRLKRGTTEPLIKAINELSRKREAG